MVSMLPSFSFAYGVLRRFLPEEKVESIKGLTLTADGNGAVFDVATEDLDAFLAGTFCFYLMEFDFGNSSFAGNEEALP